MGDNKTLALVHDAFRWILPAMAAQQETYHRYALYAREHSDARWIGTPWVVLSSTRGILKDVSGGHNLDSTVVPFVLDRKVPTGDVRVFTRDGRSAIRVNPNDASRLSRLTRIAGVHLGNDRDLEAVLRRALPRALAEPPRPANVVLGRPAASGAGGPRAPRGAQIGAPEAGPFNRFASGWELTPEKPPGSLANDLRAARARYKNSVVLERRDDGIFYVSREEGQLLKAFTPEDATDLLVSLSRTSSADVPLQVHLSGLTAPEAQAMVQSVRVRTAALGRGEIRGRLRTEGLPLDTFSPRAAAEFDFSRSVIRELAELPGSRGLHFTVDVPPTVTASGSTHGFIRGRIAFARTAAADVIERLKLRVRSVFDRILSRPASPDVEPLRIMDDIERELRGIARESGVEIETLELQFQSQMEDYHLVRRDLGQQSTCGQPS